MNVYTSDAVAMLTLHVSADDECAARRLIEQYQGIEFGDYLVTNFGDRGTVRLTSASVRTVRSLVGAVTNDGIELAVSSNATDGALVGDPGRMELIELVRAWHRAAEGDNFDKEYEAAADLASAVCAAVGLPHDEIRPADSWDEDEPRVYAALDWVMV